MLFCHFVAKNIQQYIIFYDYYVLFGLSKQDFNKYKQLFLSGKLLLNPESEIKLFTNDKAGKSGRARWYIANKKVITTGLEHLNRWKVIVSSANAGGQKRSNQRAIVDNHSAFGRSRVALKTFATEQDAKNFLKYATNEIIRFAFLLTDGSLTSLAKRVPDLLDYSDANGMIDYKGDSLVELKFFIFTNGKVTRIVEF